MKGFAHNLILKVRVFGTLIYKWPIPEMSSSNLHSSVLWVQVVIATACHFS